MWKNGTEFRNGVIYIYDFIKHDITRTFTDDSFCKNCIILP